MRNMTNCKGFLIEVFGNLLVPFSRFFIINLLSNSFFNKLNKFALYIKYASVLYFSKWVNSFMLIRLGEVDDNILL